MDLRTRLNLIYLAADDPDRGRAEVIEALKSWPNEGFHLQHYTSLHAVTQIELYTGDTEVAWKHVAGQWPALEDSLLLRTPAVRVEAMQLRARTALASSDDGKDGSKLRLAEKMARKIEKVNMSWSKPFATLVRATIAHQRSDGARANALLLEAARGCDHAEMRLHAAAVRRRLGERLRDARGRQMITEADAWMGGQNIKNP